MVDLDELIKKWETSALNFREAESLINLLIIHNRKLEHWQEKAFEAHPNIDLDMANL